MSEFENISKSFNEDFCNVLEYHLSRTFGNSSNKEISSFWCDGVVIPLIENQSFKKDIIDIKEINTQAWIGPNGQGKYRMKIKFGPLSLNTCKKGLDLKECLPDEESMEWVTLDIDENTIELQLK